MIEVEQFFKDAVERKNQRIEKLMNDLQVSEDMYCTLQQAHMSTIEKLISKLQFYECIKCFTNLCIFRYTKGSYSLFEKLL